MVAKKAYLAKLGREKRNLDRQRSKVLTKEEQERIAELEKKRLVCLNFVI